MPKVKLNGISMQYHLEGPRSARPLVFVHGFPFSLALWKGQEKFFKKNYRVLTFDLRGMGQSALGKAPQPLEAYADDLLALLDKLKLRNPVLCGLSMGGYVAMRSLQKAPERFSGLVLCHTRPDADGDAAKLRRASGIKTIREKGARAFIKGLHPTLMAPETPASKPEIARDLLKIMKENNANGMSNALMAMAARTDSSAFLAEIRIPCLVIAGEKDALMPLEIVEGMAAKIPGSQFICLPEAGHVGNLEAPHIFNAALEEFLKTLK